MNILFCSVGRRVELLKDFRNSLSSGSKIVATDMSQYAPASFFADTFYRVPPIFAEDYIPELLRICKKEKIHVLTTLIDPEIEVLAKAKSEFEELGVTVLVPSENTAKICFDKYEMFKYLKKNGIQTVPTYGTIEEAKEAIEEGVLKLPVFVKPRKGSGSVGARRIEKLEDLEVAFASDPSIIVQKLMKGIDLDADIYVDIYSHKVVRIFTKRKLESKIGGANKTVSYYDSSMVEFLCQAIETLEFSGAIDVDVFCCDGEYYLSEINPRFGGAYLHAYASGVDFVPLIENNVRGIENSPDLKNCGENTVMMMYDSVVVSKYTDE